MNFECPVIFLYFANTRPVAFITKSIAGIRLTFLMKNSDLRAADCSLSARDQRYILPSLKKNDSHTRSIDLWSIEICGFHIYYQTHPFDYLPFWE